MTSSSKYKYRNDKRRNPEIDIGLAALVDNAEPQQTLTTREIADVCGSTYRYIHYLERRALAKLREKLIQPDDMSSPYCSHPLESAIYEVLE